VDAVGERKMACTYGKSNHNPSKVQKFVSKLIACHSAYTVSLVKSNRLMLFREKAVNRSIRNV
jgi:hypothetical protein